QAGDQVADRWRQMPSQVNRLLREARGEPSPGQVRARLRLADDLARRHDAAALRSLTGDAPALSRRALVQDLLVWQAHRAWQDHWSAEDPGATPYYRVAGLGFLIDARQLAPWPRSRNADVEDLEAKLTRPAGLRLDAAPAGHLTAGERLS